MPDATELMKVVKRAAKEAVEAGKPAEVCFGEVTNDSPLEILVDQRLYLGEAQLVLTRNVTDFDTQVTVHWNTEGKLGKHKHEVKFSTETAGSIDPHKHDLKGETEETNLFHTHTITGRKIITIHNRLVVGDSVILLRQQGGQKYIVVDRIG